MEYRTVAQPHHLPELGPSRMLIRFSVTTIILVSAAAFSNIGFARGLAALTWMAMIVSSLVAVIRRERPFESTLNHWDDMVGYAAMFSLVSIFTQAFAA
jgi:hypothetical protein